MRLTMSNRSRLRVVDVYTDSSWPDESQPVKAYKDV